MPLDDVRPGALVDESRRATAVDVVGAAPERTGRGRRGEVRPPPELAGHVTFSWRQLDWYEEDEQVLVHARTPYERVDTLRSSRLVESCVGGETVARSVRPLLLFETQSADPLLPAVRGRAHGVAGGERHGDGVPVQGQARYWSVRTGGTLVADAAWSYPDPIPENPKIRDLVCFFTERVDLVVDGVAQPRTVSPWSDGTADAMDQAADR